MFKMERYEAVSPGGRHGAREENVVNEGKEFPGPGFDEEFEEGVVNTR